MLLAQFRDVPGVKSFHMASKIQGEEDRITFLYKFIEGDCPSSFGMNVARMAGLPDMVVSRAKEKSADFSRKMAFMLEPPPPLPPKQKKGILKKPSIEASA